MTTKDELYPTVKLEARLMDDGTLWIKSENLTEIGRVIVEDGKTFCKQFYQDAQPEPNYDEWCHDCKEYDQEQHCCPRWNMVIREALKDAQPEIIRCKDCKHWTQSTGKMTGYGLGRCDFHDADLVACNGFCYWAERRTDDER